MAGDSNTMTVTNNGSTSVTIAGQTLAAQGGQATYTATSITAVCADLNFMAGFISGSISFVINSFGSMTNTSPSIMVFLLGIATGNISV